MSESSQPTSASEDVGGPDDRPDALLRVRDLTVTYGGAVAVTGVNIDVPPGSIRSIIGTNGAGKSSTLRALIGLTPPASGSVVFDGQELVGRQVDYVVDAGVALVPEQRRLFASMTVLENLQLGAYRWSKKKGWKQELERIWMYFPEVKDKMHARAGSLSGGQQQMLAVARALMSRPQLLMLDEPCTGLAPIIVKRLAQMMERLRDEGLTLLLIEQNAQIALEVSDYGYVMETGRVVLEGPSSDLRESDYVRDVYLGA